MDEEQKKRMQGHRQRVRDQIVSRDSLLAVPEYQILEFLLTFGIPRKDTKALAYSLLDKFGDFPSVLSAPIEELRALPNMTNTAAVLLHTLPNLCTYYEVKRMQGKKILSSKEIIPYVRSLAPAGKEAFFLICMDKNDVFICGEEVTDGENDLVRVDVKVLLTRALKYKAKKIILAHNHPSGFSIPSHEDILSTSRLYSFFANMDIELVDHMIIGDKKAFSIAHNREIV